MSAQPLLFDTPPLVQAPERIGQARVVRRLARQVLTRPTGMLKGLDFTLNPYSGCTFGCEYCYAAFFQPDEDKAREWGLWVEVKENALALICQEPRLAGASVMVGSVTDPYQPLERETRLTRSLLEHMAGLRPQPKVRVQTRSPLVSRDADVLLRFSDLRVGMSVTTDSDEVRKRYEPKCASIGRRLQAVRELAAAGVEVTVSIAPMLPITDVAAFAKAVRESGASRIWTGYFHPGTRKFASGTRENALVLAKQDGWTFERYVETSLALKKLLPDLVVKPSEEGGSP
ncbi:MAG: radical SAM protein [Armatimonadetes bacterium]|nr:radical SAM protein [Armatimonadota bacterium]